MTIPAISGPVREPAAGGKPQQLIIILHGWGADGANLIDIASLIAPHLPQAKFIAPNGPYPCEVNPMGYQWFSLLDRNPQAMLAGARHAEAVVNQFIDTQLAAHGLSEENLALVGFSQGTMTSLHTALRRKNPPACVVGFSGALIGAEVLADEIQSRPPVCLIHGDMDDVVPFSAMRMAQSALEANHVPVETHARPRLGHSIDMQGLDIATAFLKRHVG